MPHPHPPGHACALGECVATMRTAKPFQSAFLSREGLVKAIYETYYGEPFAHADEADVAACQQLADHARELLMPKSQCPAYPNRNMTTGPDMRCMGDLGHRGLHENTAGWRWGEVS